MIKDFLKRATASLLAATLALPFPQAVSWAAPASAAKSTETVTLDSIDVSPDSVLVHLSGPTKYTSFVTSTPPRLVVQFENTEYQADAKSVTGTGKYLKSVRSGQFQHEPMVSRVVLDLNDVVGYKIDKTGNDVVIALGGSAPPESSGSAAAPRPKVSLPKAAAVKTAAEAAVKALDAESNPMAKVGEKGGMTTEPSAELAQIARSEDAAQPSTPLDKAPPARHVSAGDRPRAVRPDIVTRLPRDLVTLDFDSTDIRDVLRLLAAKAKVNIIFGPDVSGNITLHLTDVPFADAFRTILTMMSLSTTQIGDNILRVLTPTALRNSQTAAATVTKVFALNYAKATDLLPVINGVRAAEGRTGTSIANDKTNSLIITESVEGMIATEHLVAQLDVRPRQVLIEAKLVEVGLSNSFNYGIQWDSFQIEPGRGLGKQGVTSIGAPLGIKTAPFGNPLDGNVAAGIDSFPVGATGRGTGVSLPADKVFGAFTLGRVTNNYFLNATLTAAAANGKIKVLSDPKIATLNNQAANINVTTQFPYTTSNVASTGVQTQSVQYVTTGITLSVTPSINADGRIMLNINPNVSQPSATAAASITGAPGIDSRSAQTTVLVRDGETVVIGGLINDTVSDQIAKIPLLGDLPIIGWLFKKKSTVRNRAELLIFVTPKIMAD